MIIQNSVSTNEHREELLDPEGTGLSFLTMKVDIDQYIDRCSPWHWHPMFELAYAATGSLDYDIPGEKITLREGDLLFVNSSILHTVHPHQGGRGCILYCILFDSHFLSGLYNSAMEEKYFRPLRKCDNLAYYHIPGTHPWAREMAREFQAVIDSDTAQPYGYEFSVQAHLARFWLMLLQAVEDRLSSRAAKDSVEIARLKQMILFIQQYYGERILLADIAQAANISTRECSRCFRNNMNTTPVEFLNRYRVHLAAELLLDTAKSITEISGECGFGSNSYFSKVFQRTMHCMPKDYRRRGRQPETP